MGPSPHKMFMAMESAAKIFLKLKNRFKENSVFVLNLKKTVFQEIEALFPELRGNDLEEQIKEILVKDKTVTILTRNKAFASELFLKRVRLEETINKETNGKIKLTVR